MNYKIGQIVKVKGHKFEYAVIDTIYTNLSKMLVHVKDGYAYAVINEDEIIKEENNSECE